MKVIDLLVKIANGNIPKRIIYNEYVYQWNNIIKNYEREVDTDTTLNWDYIAIECLNEEVEVIEDTPKEDKKIEKLKIYDNPIEWCCNGRAITDTEKDIIDKLNEIIDKINGEKNERNN